MAPLRRVIRGDATPWIVSQLRQGHVVRLARLGDLPDEAAVDRQTLERLGTRSAVLVPLVVGGSVAGTLAVGTLRAERHWPDELVPRLRLLAAVFAGALARQQAERAVRESEERFLRMADSAPMMVWLSGPDGGRTYVNQRWLDFTGRGAGPRAERELDDGVHRDDQPDLARTLAAALARGAAVHRGVPARAPGSESTAGSWITGCPGGPTTAPCSATSGSAVDVTQLRAAQRALLETDLLRSAIFGALHGQVAALDKSGRIIAVNHAWGRFALENGGNPVRVSIGASYLDVCRDAAAREIARPAGSWQPSARYSPAARLFRSSTRAARPPASAGSR